MHKHFIISLFILTLLLISVSFAQKGSLELADQYYQEKSFRLAADMYEDFLEAPNLSKAQLREIQFKWADASWRTRETNRYEAATKALIEFIEGDVKEDVWWAEANESLAEHYLVVNRWQHQEQIKNYLQSARQYWAGSKKIKEARPRFIQASFTLGDYISTNWGWQYNQIVPVGILKTKILPENPQQNGLYILYEEILQVAQSDEDKAKVYYGLAMSYYQQYHDAKKKEESVEYFNKVIKEFAQSEWADDAYYQLGSYYLQLQDFKQALVVFRKFVQTFKAGESQFVDDAKRQIESITNPRLQLSTSYVFLPDSEIQLNMNWRNVKGAQLNIYPIDLTQEVKFDLKRSATDSNRGVNNYQDILRRMVDNNEYQQIQPVVSQELNLTNDGEYKQHYKNQGLANFLKSEDEKEINVKQGKLEPGAYLALVTANGVKAYDLILVTDLGLMVKAGGHSALIFAFDSMTGEPRKNTNIKFQYRYYNDSGHWTWEEGEQVTDADGLVDIKLKSATHRKYNTQHQLFVAARNDHMQAFSQSRYYSHNSNSAPWWLYAYADRPAYRPNEKISFKATLRSYDNETFQTPTDQEITARVHDPRGTKVFEKKYTLNQFGSFFDELTLDEKAPLGEYTLYIHDADNNTYLSQAKIFRLEEYKLPEFLVNIATKPNADGAKTYQLGDTVEVELDAQYYFGGAVANADVEYLVYQSPYNHTYYPSRRYPWFYEEMHSQRNYRGYGESLIKKESIQTDAHGKATFSFETPENATQDYTYRVEARVVDESRREITATANIKVTKNAFYAYLTPKNNVYRPGDKAEVDIKVLTANDEPVVLDGRISVSRYWWHENKIHNNKVVKPAHYSETEVFSKFVKTNEHGEAVFSFEPEQDGYYVVKFTGYDDKKGNEIVSQTNVFVCDKQSRDLGYRYGGIQIIAEKDTYAIGETAKVMLVADKPGRWILFAAEAEEIFDYQMYKLDGTVKLVEFTVKDTFTPNIYLTAGSVDKFNFQNTNLQLIVPPDEKYLDVKIISDKKEYRPQEEGLFGVEVKDKDGNPVAAEISLGLVDASVYYIQNELVKDIREFFYGTKRQLAVQTQLSFNQKQYQKLVRDQNGNLVNEDVLKMQLKNAKIAADSKHDVRQVAEKEAQYAVNGAVFMGDSVDSMSPMAASKGVRVSGGFQSSSYGGRAEGKLNKAKRADKNELFEEKDQAAGFDESNLQASTLRQDFRSTAFWQPTIVTDETGKASIKIKFPDSLTTWRATARSITQNTSVGNITHETKTKKDVIVRLQAPRFFTERDLVTISAIVHNYTDIEQKIKVIIAADALKVEDKKEVWVTIAPEGEERVDWRATAGSAGFAKITVSAQGTKDADAMVKSYPVIPHGIEKFIAQAMVLKGKIAQEVSHTFSLDVPRERIEESTSLQLNMSPSLAATLLDALPYLASYPYGCVEQTMSRFLPAIIVKKTMVDLGLSTKDVNEYLADVFAPRADPQFDQPNKYDALAQLDQMTKAGVDRLVEFQHADGGWGWWKKGDSDRFMSAYVYWGLQMAKQAGVRVNQGVLNRAQKYLQKQLVEEEDHPDTLAWMLHALSFNKKADKFEEKQTQRLWEMREELNAYTRALFALALHNRGDERAIILARNIANGIEKDLDNGTAHWGSAGVHYRWSEGGVEATAFNIKALANILPESDLLEPAVKWMALNRRGARWKNTRDTAIAILGLADYLKTTDELTPDFDYTVLLNGKTIKSGHVDRSNVFTFDRNIYLANDALKNGANKVEVRTTGKGALYVSGYLKYFTLEENITPEGNEVFVTRRYLIEDTAETLLKGYDTEWTPLENGANVKSGDRIKVEITLEAKNHYEYLIVEDYKPAGLEAVQIRSDAMYATMLDRKGKESSTKTWIYQELRDQKGVFFIDKLKQGKHQITYELRAEVPGTFHGMPNQTHAMYVPEIRANSSEMMITVDDRD